ncbi:hypothetical protein CCM_04938 [Cordyceps militaris CM01]|uniref:Uncharacterized protein n=1 Tax=Cordyceps militaris (strain CM01) TaxID=983644 RepID=G3JFJ0_CORMM|nr:uncharacterized protein CCM_04938 [Cordyceps militaris CM01]EGX93564.1 hypothetical protein CCM_04938 [Cordyceps militaris CM01]
MCHKNGELANRDVAASLLRELHYELRVLIVMKVAGSGILRKYIGDTMYIGHETGLVRRQCQDAIDLFEQVAEWVDEHGLVAMQRQIHA